MQKEQAAQAMPGREPKPLIALGASAILPGLGQAYAGKYVKGGLFLATEVIMGLVAFNRYEAYRLDREYAITSRLAWDKAWNMEKKGADSLALYRDYDQWSAAFGDTSRTLFEAESLRYSQYFDRLMALSRQASQAYRLDAYNERLSRAVFSHVICWMAGCYAFNLFDALQSTGRFADGEPRSPLAAGLLSAVPLLGLGQIYNGSLSKAGVVIMTHTALGFLAMNYHSLMRECETRLADIESGAEKSREYVDRWEARRKHAFRQRNTYLWYGLLFYFYGIFDAVVDAHLHDIEKQMRLKPDLVANSDGVSLSVDFSF